MILDEFGLVEARLQNHNYTEFLIEPTRNGRELVRRGIVRCESDYLGKRWFQQFDCANFLRSRGATFNGSLWYGRKPMSDVVRLCNGWDTIVPLSRGTAVVRGTLT